MTSFTHFKKVGILAAAFLFAAGACTAGSNGVVKVWSHGFVDLEGAKTDAVIIEYESPVEASSLSLDTYEVVDYAIWLEENNGFERAIEKDGDDIEGNEGRPVRIYVNSKPSTTTDRKSTRLNSSHT